MGGPHAEELLHGEIKSFSFRKGYGFIHNIDNLDQDVYMNKDHMPVEWQQIEQALENTPVSFYVDPKPDGKYHARNVTRQNIPEDNQYVSGVVKSFSIKNGFGFIAVDNLGDDVYFHSDRLPQQYAKTKLEGATLTFLLSKKKDGKLEARECRVVSLAGQDNLNQGQQRKRINFNDNNTDQSPQQKRQKTKGNNKNANAQKGVVKSFNLDNNYGFIVSDYCAEDLRFRMEDIVASDGDEIRKGQNCSFVPHQNEDGKFAAKNIQLFGEEKQQEISKPKRATPKRKILNQQVKKEAGEELNSNEAFQVIQKHLPYLSASELIALNSMVADNLSSCL